MRRSIITFNLKLIHNGISQSFKRSLSGSESVQRRNHLFNLEMKRQLESVGRIEKIEVHYKGLPEEKTLIMNKDISTPYDCARHLSEWHCDNSALALVDDTTVWDMHKPLTSSCTLQLVHFKTSDPSQVNKAFWRTCSLMLGATACVAFKQQYNVLLHSFPGPDVRSGSFVYDIDIPELKDWSPTDIELRTLSAEFIKLCRSESPLERLEVDAQFATEVFQDNYHKKGQIPGIASANNGKVTLYRVGDHIDISKGPMITNTKQIGRATVASVHLLKDLVDGKSLYRFQGVALPVGFIVNHVVYGIIENRAKKLNAHHLPLEMNQEPKAMSAAS